MSDVREVHNAHTPVTEIRGAYVALQTPVILSRFPGDAHVDSFTTSYHEFGEDWISAETSVYRSEPFFTTHAECSDLFFWGCADAEPVTPGNIHHLRQTVADLTPLYRAARERERGWKDQAREELHRAYEAWTAAHPENKDENGNYPGWGKSEDFKEQEKKYPVTSYRYGEIISLLFSARSRGMRPQGAYYKLFPRDTWELFDACGPEREVGVGNPYVPGGNTHG